MASWINLLAISALESVLREQKSGGHTVRAAVRSVIRYPIKAIATFFFAPLLAFRVARMAKNPVRRFIAGIGLFIAMLAAWLAGTALGTAAGALLIASYIGLFWGIGFFVGTGLSVLLSVAFSFLVLNSTSWFFLKMSSEDVIEHLKTISE